MANILISSLKRSINQNIIKDKNCIIFFVNKVHTKTQQKDNKNVEQKDNQESKKLVSNLRYIYPEFLPDPKIKWRNSVREKLERSDMIKRRTQIDIPEFYVGSIMAVTISDPHSQGKVNRFVGICIDREGCGLRSWFILRNIIDHQGIEIKYDIYDPAIRKIEVLKLEKRLDKKLYYLRDALPEYSTFDVDMIADFIPENTEVPINPIKVKLKPRPWLERWPRQDLKGIEGLERDYCRDQPWEKYDIMKQYMKTIPEEEQNEIFLESYSQLHHLENIRKKIKRKRTVNLPKKKA